MVQPLRVATTRPIIKFLKEQVFSIFGVPQIIMCDNGSQFVSKEFRKYLDDLKVQKIWFNARYHPQVNPTERVNRVMVTAISSYIKDSHREWDKHIFEIAQALRLAKHDATEVAPAFLMFGRHVPPSGDFYGSVDDKKPIEIRSRVFWSKEIAHLPELYEDVKQRLHKAYETCARQYNFRKRPVTFSIGDVVWKRNFVLSDAAKGYSKKLAPKYVPCKVKKVLSKVVYLLEDLEGHELGKFHSKDLKENFCDFSDEESTQTLD